MKKLILLSALWSSCALSNSPIYCPDLIRCIEANHVESCAVIGGNQEYWNNLNITNHIEKGTYYFNGAKTIKLSDGIVASCGYEMRPSGSADAIGFTAKPTVHLHAAKTLPSAWKSVNQHLDTCTINSAIGCPFSIE